MIKEKNDYTPSQIREWGIKMQGVIFIKMEISKQYILSQKYCLLNLMYLKKLYLEFKDYFTDVNTHLFDTKEFEKIVLKYNPELSEAKLTFNGADTLCKLNLEVSNDGVTEPFINSSTFPALIYGYNNNHYRLSSLKASQEVINSDKFLGFLPPLNELFVNPFYKHMYHDKVENQYVTHYMIPFYNIDYSIKISKFGQIFYVPLGKYVVISDSLITEHFSISYLRHFLFKFDPFLFISKFCNINHSSTSSLQFQYSESRNNLMKNHIIDADYTDYYKYFNLNNSKLDPVIRSAIWRIKKIFYDQKMFLVDTSPYVLSPVINFELNQNLYRDLLLSSPHSSIHNVHTPNKYTFIVKNIIRNTLLNKKLSSFSINFIDLQYDSIAKSSFFDNLFKCQLKTFMKQYVENSGFNHTENIKSIITVFKNSTEAFLNSFCIPEISYLIINSSYKNVI